LIWIDKVQSCRVDLKSTTYDFLDKLSQCIKKNNRLKCFGIII